MPFPFSHVCDLLEDLHRLHFRDHPLLPKELEKRRIDLANGWLRIHKSELNAFNTQENAALWVLRPDKLGDREYGITASTLQLIIARIYKLSREEYVKLRRWESSPQLYDLAACVEEARENMKDSSSPSTKNRVAVEEIHNSLLRIAACNPKSSTAIQSLAQHQVNPADTIELLDKIYNRLRSRDAKWLTRFILKDYGAILLPDKWNWTPGYSGMPNCAEMTVDVFTRPPPTEILDGTKRIKALSITPTRAVERQRQVLQVGWPKRTVMRSRETSPICPPTFAKGILKPNPNTPTPQTSSAGLSKSSLILPLTVSSAKHLQVPIPATAAFEPSTIPKPLNPTAARNPLFSKPNIQMVVNIATPEIQTSSSIIARKSPEPSTTRERSLSAFNESMESVKSPETRHSPSRSGCSIMTPLPSGFNKTPTSPRGALSNLSPTTAICNQINPGPSNPTKSPRRQPPNPLITAGTGTCRMNSSECSLIGCIFLLAPSIAESSRLINELLPWHGVQYFTDFRGLANPHLLGHCPRTRLRYRKIVLVETQNHEETVGFLRQIKGLNLRIRVKRGSRREGKDNIWAKELVEVYDWRLLETIAKMDLGKQYAYDPWKRNLIGPI